MRSQSKFFGFRDIARRCKLNINNANFCRNLQAEIGVPKATVSDDGEGDDQTYQGLGTDGDPFAKDDIDDEEEAEFA